MIIPLNLPLLCLVPFTDFPPQLQGNNSTCCPLFLWQRGKRALYKETTKLLRIHFSVCLPISILDASLHLGMQGAQFPVVASAAQLFASGGLACRCWGLSFPASQQRGFLLLFFILSFFNFLLKGGTVVSAESTTREHWHSLQSYPPASLLQGLSQPQEPPAV